MTIAMATAAHASNSGGENQSECKTSPREEEEHDVTIEVDIDATYPNGAWEERYKNQFPLATTLKPKSLLMSDPNANKNFIRFVCMSDTHSKAETGDFLSRVPDGDVLLHAGDFTLYSDVEEYIAFNEFLGKLPHKLKVAIPGNHELDLDPRGLGKNQRKIRCHLGLPPVISQFTQESVQQAKSLVSEAFILIDEMVEICGIKIYGLPWLPQYGLYGFGLSRGGSLLAKYNRCPSNIDILLSHGPPLGFGDFITRRKHVGCVELLNSVTNRIKPNFVISGHIHEDYGIRTDGVRTYINCAACNKNYRPVNNPVVFDYPIPEPHTGQDFHLLTQRDLKVTQPWRKRLP